jgi:hypothetical protein
MYLMLYMYAFAVYSLERGSNIFRADHGSAAIQFLIPVEET